MGEGDSGVPLALLPAPARTIKGLISPCCVGEDSCVLARPTRAFLMAAERGWYLV